MLSIIFNVIMIGMLGGVLYYAWRLDRRLSALDKNRADMERFVNEFSGQIGRAERGIKALKEAAHDSGAEVEQNIVRATALRDELNFLIDASDKIATRLTNSTSQAQSDALTRKSAPVEKPEKAEEKKPELKTVKPAKMEEKPVPPAETGGQPKILPAWLKSLRPEKEPQPVKASETPKAEQPKEAGGRSQAERDLQQALDKMR